MNANGPDSDKESNLLLQASAKRLFESLMEQTADRIYIKDRQSRFVAVSAALAKFHGFKNRHELEGLSDFDVFTKEHAEKAYKDEQEIIRTGVPMISQAERLTLPSGAVAWASSSKAPFYLSSGKLVGIIGISRDITAERIAQEQLAEREHRLREQNAIMQSDYESAHKVQSVMIPGRLPVLRHIEMAYLWEPMTSVGGDMISFPRNPGKRLLFFLGDVCGHGVTAAFYTVLLKYLTAHCAEVYADDPRSFLNAVNERLTGRINNGFVTGLAGHFGSRKRNGGRDLFVAHAGHRQVLVYRASLQRIERIELANGTVMGLPGGSASSVTRLKLEVGDRFYAFTDGIFEASNPEGEEYGLDRLAALFENASDLPIKETLGAVHEAVSKFTDAPDPQDDVTLLGFEIT